MNALAGLVEQGGVFDEVMEEVLEGFSPKEIEAISLAIALNLTKTEWLQPHRLVHPPAQESHEPG